MTPVRAFDLFCGAGGTSTGLAHACASLGRRLELGALNHWPLAIETHSANHPAATHLCASADAIDPRQAVPGGRLDLLVASPECLHFSTARGGRPMNDQSRASAWHVLRWAESLRVDRILIENVPEFASWGPLGVTGRPIKRRKGETFRAFCEALRSLGYAVEHRILNAADYGDATTRRRLFLMARRGRAPIRWPVPSHAAPGPGDLFGAATPWRAAREIIDWSLRGRSIFGRKRPLAPTTLARIAEGLRRFGGPAAAPFLRLLQALPARGVVGSGAADCEPFVLGQQTGSVARSVGAPLPTVATDGAIALVEPFLIPHFGERAGQAPRTHSVRAPLPTVTGHGAGALIEPFILPPLGVHARGGAANPARALDRPLQTITSRGGGHLIEPYLVRYNGTGLAESVGAPLPTVTTKDRFGLVEPQARVDILFRMLTPRELAAAMSFPADYQFAGNRGEVVKQVGNAVPVGVATALCRALLEDAA